MIWSELGRCIIGFSEEVELVPSSHSELRVKLGSWGSNSATTEGGLAQTEPSISVQHRSGGPSSVIDLIYRFIIICHQRRYRFINGIRGSVTNHFNQSRTVISCLGLGLPVMEKNSTRQPPICTAPLPRRDNKHSIRNQILSEDFTQFLYVGGNRDPVPLRRNQHASIRRVGFGRGGGVHQ